MLGHGVPGRPGRRWRPEARGAGVVLPGARPSMMTPRSAFAWPGRHNARMDPYGVLGLEPGASRADITTAYRRLAKEWHPDRRGGDEADRRMAEINGAYDLLRAEAWHALHANRPLRRHRGPAPRRPRRVAGPGRPPCARTRAARGPRAAGGRVAGHARYHVGEPAGAARGERPPAPVAPRRHGHGPGPDAAVRGRDGGRAPAASAAAARGHAAGPVARRPPARVRRAAARDRPCARPPYRGRPVRHAPACAAGLSAFRRIARGASVPARFSAHAVRSVHLAAGRDARVRRRRPARPLRARRHAVPARPGATPRARPASGSSPSSWRGSCARSGSRTRRSTMTATSWRRCPARCPGRRSSACSPIWT